MKILGGEPREQSVPHKYRIGQPVLRSSVPVLNVHGQSQDEENILALCMPGICGLWQTLSILF